MFEIQICWTPLMLEWISPFQAFLAILWHKTPKQSLVETSTNCESMWIFQHFIWHLSWNFIITEIMVYSLSANKRASQHNHKSKTIHYMLGLPFIFCSALHTHSPLPSPSQEEGKIKFAHTTTNIINCSFSFQFYLEHFRKFIFTCYTLGMRQLVLMGGAYHVE